MAKFVRNVTPCIFLIFLLSFFNTLRAQDIAVKTNVLYWASTTPNLSFEFGLADRWTLDVTGGYNPFTLNKEKNTKVKHWMVMPEARYWFCEKFNGHFIGVHTGYTFFNISNVQIPFAFADTKAHRYQGWGTGVGVSYGYSWIIGKRWNIEANIGLGYIYTRFDKYNCVNCGKFKGSLDKHYFGPTKAGVSIIYLIK